MPISESTSNEMKVKYPNENTSSVTYAPEELITANPVVGTESVIFVRVRVRACTFGTGEARGAGDGEDRVGRRGEARGEWEVVRREARVCVCVR